MEKASITDAISNETKSSAGDKFETGREMMNQERNRTDSRISLVNQQLRILNDMASVPSKNEVQFGTLVETKNSHFLFGLGLGKVEISSEKIFVLSLNSPIGKAFLNSRVGDTVNFTNKTYTIQSIC